MGRYSRWHSMTQWERIEEAAIRRWQARQWEEFTAALYGGTPDREESPAPPMHLGPWVSGLAALLLGYTMHNVWVGVFVYLVLMQVLRLISKWEEAWVALDNFWLYTWPKKPAPAPVIQKETVSLALPGIVLPCLRAPADMLSGLSDVTHTVMQYLASLTAYLTLSQQVDDALEGHWKTDFQTSQWRQQLLRAKQDMVRSHNAVEQEFCRLRPLQADKQASASCVAKARQELDALYSQFDKKGTAVIERLSRHVPVPEQQDILQAKLLEYIQQQTGACAAAVGSTGQQPTGAATPATTPSRASRMATSFAAVTTSWAAVRAVVSAVLKYSIVFPIVLVVCMYKDPVMQCLRVICAPFSPYCKQAATAATAAVIAPLSAFITGTHAALCEDVAAAATVVQSGAVTVFKWLTSRSAASDAGLLGGWKPGTRGSTGAWPQVSLPDRISSLVDHERSIIRAATWCQLDLALLDVSRAAVARWQAVGRQAPDTLVAAQEAFHDALVALKGTVTVSTGGRSLSLASSYQRLMCDMESYCLAKRQLQAELCSHVPAMQLGAAVNAAYSAQVGDIDAATLASSH